ncbi:MAG: DUF4194 domain-containing protein [Planctomycetia bacterium]|nr:DUF4194 domain-containing protein [Planctomycetia bacterium]
MRGDLPDFRDWSIAAVRLLQGVVDTDDGRVWDVLMSNVSQLEGYFARLGLRLIVDEPEGLAYLRQLTEDEFPAGYDALPKLFRSTRLSYGQTLLCVLLRDEFRRFEDEETRNERCVVEESELFDQWNAYFPQQGDDVKLQRELLNALSKLEELGFVRRFGQEPPSWEVRRILKARLTADELERLQRLLQEAAGRRHEHRQPPLATT